MRNILDLMVFKMDGKYMRWKYVWEKWDWKILIDIYLMRGMRFENIDEYVYEGDLYWKYIRNSWDDGVKILMRFYRRMLNEIKILMRKYMKIGWEWDLIKILVIKYVRCIWWMKRYLKYW